MLRQILTTSTTMAAILFLTACQGSQTDWPTATPAPIDLPTFTPTEETTASTDPLCFTPADLIPVSFTPDNKKLVIRTRSGVQIFNLEAMKEQTFLESPEPVISATLSPDGQLIAWSLEDHSIQLIQVSNGRLVSTLEGHTDIVFKLRFSTSSDRFYSASHDGSVRIWNNQGKLIRVLEIGSEVVGMGISADGTKLATIPFDGPVELWDLTDYQKISALGGTGGFDTSDANFSPDGKYLAADLASGLFLWSLSDGKPLWDDLKNSLAITFSPDGQYLAYANVDDNNVVLSSPDGAQILRTMEGMPGTIWELFFSPDSSMLAATDGSEIRIWQVEDGRLLHIGKPACP